MIKPFIYFFLKHYVKLSLYIYFKQYKVYGKELVPEGPLIFVSNHQNAFMDALLLTCATKRDPYFLARASIFSKKWSSVLLNTIRLIPIYRIRDGFSSLKKNEKTFENCIKLLSCGESILIFPEGNHNNRFYLRPFQKGAARIAFESESQNSFNLNLKIVPVGIQYEDYDKTGSSVMVNIGNPIPVKSYEKVYSTEPITAIKMLSEDLQVKVSSLMLDITPVNMYDELYSTWRKYRTKPQNLQTRLQNDQDLIKILKNNPSQNPGVQQKKEDRNILKSLVHSIFRIINKINLFIPDLLFNYIIKRKLKEPMFEGSIRFSLWAFGGTFFLILQTWTIYLLSKDLLISFGYLVLSIACAIFYIQSKKED